MSYALKLDVCSGAPDATLGVGNGRVKRTYSCLFIARIDASDGTKNAFVNARFTLSLTSRFAGAFRSFTTHLRMVKFSYRKVPAGSAYSRYWSAAIPRSTGWLPVGVVIIGTESALLSTIVGAG
jgi:hypothetical protein